MTIFEGFPELKVINDHDTAAATQRFISPLLKRRLNSVQLKIASAFTEEAINSIEGQHLLVMAQRFLQVG